MTSLPPLRQHRRQLRHRHRRRRRGLPRRRRNRKSLFLKIIFFIVFRTTVETA